MEKGKAVFYYGTMNSGKSLKLLTKKYELEKIGLKVQVLKSNLDTRDGSKIISRIGLDCNCLLVSNSDVNNIELLCDGYDVVMIDEVQFMDVELLINIVAYCQSTNINVYMFGLLKTYKGYLFDASESAIELADELRELRSYCKCGRKATHNFLKATIDSDEDIVPGGDDMYEVLCSKCFMKQMFEKYERENELEVEEDDE